MKPFDLAATRLAARVTSVAKADPFVMIGHSLGCIIIRAVLPRLQHQPVACFFLAPPNSVTKAASYFKSNKLYRLLTGESGQHLASGAFMSRLPVPDMPVRIYAGVSGPRGKRLPFAHEENDGILAASETALDIPNASVLRVPSMHTFIMNSALVTEDIVATTRALTQPVAS